MLSAVSVALILAVYYLVGEGLASPQLNHNGTSYVHASTTELLSKPNAIGVKVGAYVDNLHDLSLENRRFVAEGFYWFEWPQSVQDKLDSKEIEAKSMISISNQVDTWDGKIEGLTEKPIRLPNGNYYQQFQFSAYFHIPEINLKRFPFESVQLPVILEVYDDNLAIQNDDMILVPNAGGNALVGPFTDINGYTLANASLQPTVHAFGTDWGLNGDKLSYSAVALQVTVRSTSLPSTLKYVLPLLIVMGIVILAPSLEGQLGDSRLAIPSTGLLTLIFLQQSYQADLPALDYLTFLDWIYACAYVISIGTFVLVVWGTNFYERAPSQDKDNAIKTINRIDTVFQVSAISGTVLAGLLAWTSY